jgi:tRNA pseudouridine(55) synthase
MMSDGFIILDKPSGMTSRQAGGRAARIFGAKAFGHIGTLDPMASGVLAVALGEATKMIPFLECGVDANSAPSKEYLFSIKWGIRTDTGDITGGVLEENGAVPDYGQIAAVLPELVGEYDQMPPAYSAKKINGVPAYKLARAGGEVNLSAKRVRIHELEVFSADCGDESVKCGVRSVELGARTNVGLQSEHPACSNPTLHTTHSKLFSDSVIYRVRCSSGTYVRSLVQDIISAVNSAAETSRTAPLVGTTGMIRRLSSGGFSAENAAPLAFLENLFNNGGAVEKYLMPPDFGLDGIPVARIETADADMFRNGGFVLIKNEELKIKNGFARIYSGDNFIGIGVVEDGLLKPKRIMKCR